jgi:hypothetical protein
MGLGTAAEASSKKVSDLLKGGGGKGGGTGKGDSELEALKRRADAISASVNAQFAYNQTMKELNELLAKGLISETNYARARDKAVETMNAEGNAIRASLDPMVALQQEVDKLTKAYMQGAIEVDEWAKAVEQAKAKTDKAMGKFNWKESLESAVKDSARAMGDFFGAIISGTMSVDEAFKRMAESIISSIAKVLAEAAAAWAVKAIFGGAAGGASVGGQSAGGGALSWSPAAMLAPIGPATFAGELEAGGGAAVIPDGLFKVTVNNYAPGVDVSTARGPAGELEITVERVRAALTEDVMRGGNRFASAMERTYGVGRGR